METAIEKRPTEKAWRSVFEPATENASAAMKAWTEGQVLLTLSGVSELPLEEVSTVMNLGDSLSIMVLVDVVGPFGGQLILQFDEGGARRLMECLLGRTVGSVESWGKLEISALAETGNILASAYLNRITLLIGFRVMPSPPRVIQDFAAGVLESAIISQAMGGEQVLLCRTEFELCNQPIAWNVFFVPSLELLQPLRDCALSAMAVAE